MTTHYHEAFICCWLISIAVITWTPLGTKLCFPKLIFCFLTSISEIPKNIYYLLKKKSDGYDNLEFIFNLGNFLNNNNPFHLAEFFLLYLG